jgi:hypothetical protein
MGDEQCSVAVSADSVLGCVTNFTCNCRSVAAESYLKDEIWHVPDKPAVPVGERLAPVWHPVGTMIAAA